MSMKTILFSILVLAAVIRILYLDQVHDDVLLRWVIKDDSFDQYRYMHPVAGIMNGNWLGPRTDYPLAYSYIIALLYLFFPKDITSVFIFQIILGIIAVYVSYRAAALLFNNKIAGTIAAFVTALYSPFVFQECDIEIGSIIAYSDLFCFYFLLRALKKDQIKYFFLGGLVLGFSMIIRPNILPIFLLPYIFFAIKSSYKAKMGRSAVFLLGLMVLPALFAFRNMAVEQGFTLEPQKGIDVFWIGNAPDSPGIDLAWLDSQKELVKESGNSISKTAALFWREVKTYPDAYRHLYSRKIKMFFNAYEVPANLNYYLFKERYPVLNACFFNFAIIAPLALAGVFLVRKFPLGGLLYIFLFALILFNIIFHIQGRYRIPAAPFFIITASYTIYWLADKVSKKEWSPVKYAALAIVCAAFYTKADYFMIEKYSGGVIRAHDYGNLACAYLNKSNEMEVQDKRKNGLIKEGAAYLEKALKVNPYNRSYYKILAQAYYVLGEDQAVNRVLNDGQKIYGPGIIN